MKLCTLHILVLLCILLHLLTPLLLVTQAHPHIIKSLPGYHGLLPFTLETGYIGVGETEEVQLFYYFAESEQNVDTNPLMLWLTGGPGCSTFSGLVYEIGPVSFDYARSNPKLDIPKLQLNPYSWTKLASIIFLDSPVGTGFSYARSYEGYHSNDTLQSSYIYEFLTKWFLDHPNFRSNPLYIAGDSYAGMIVPRIVQQILNGNKNALLPKMNLKGYVLGNPTTIGNKVIYSQAEYERRVSLISEELYESAKINCNGNFVNVDRRNIICSQELEAISKVKFQIVVPYILEPMCLRETSKPTKKVPRYEHQMEDNHVDSIQLLEQQGDHPWCREDNYILSTSWTNNVRVREALNVREGTVDRWTRCNLSISYTRDYEASVVGYHKNFTNTNFKVLLYSGDQDLGIPYIGTLQWIEELQIPTTEEWRPWFVDGQVAGYVTQYGGLSKDYRLTYTTIKGGGHTAPEYKPRECLAMIRRWFELSPL
ncbi:hypothetical protein RND81_02G066500 [Saponaria officinalis]|uniref:Uncharacterized protein n=1 Tax=Saponaria officinalis TaxID=3572 RepID=A0AAW1MRY0_SAPOF